MANTLLQDAAKSDVFATDEEAQTAFNRTMQEIDAARERMKLMDAHGAYLQAQSNALKIETGQTLRRIEGLLEQIGKGR